MYKVIYVLTKNNAIGYEVHEEFFNSRYEAIIGKILIAKIFANRLIEMKMIEVNK